jgi:Holliday junction resolvase
MATLERELAAEREKVRVLREHGVEALMVARSWQLVWGDRISPDSVACFTQHEQAFLAALAATEEGTP